MGWRRALGTHSHVGRDPRVNRRRSRVGRRSLRRRHPGDEGRRLSPRRRERRPRLKTTRRLRTCPRRRASRSRGRHQRPSPRRPRRPRRRLRRLPPPQQVRTARSRWGLGTATRRCVRTHDATRLASASAFGSDSRSLIPDGSIWAPRSTSPLDATYQAAERRFEADDSPVTSGSTSWSGRLFFGPS